jgi:hypothetical protein
LSFHVTAEKYYSSLLLSSSSSSSPPTDAAESFYDRLRGGPDALQPMDMVLIGSLILLAFELLNYLVQHSGRTLLRSRNYLLAAQAAAQPHAQRRVSMLTLDLTHPSRIPSQNGSDFR